MTNRLVSKGLLGGLASLVLLAGSMGLGGCRTGADQRYNSGLTTREQYVQEKTNENNYNDGLTLSLLGGLIGARGVQVGKPGAVIFGNALSNHGSAMASASQVIVNNPTPNLNYAPVQTQGPYQVPVAQALNITLVEIPNQQPLVLRKDIEGLGNITAVVSNYCKDFNRNGVFDYPEDYGGMKQVFLPTERVTLSLASSKPERNLRIELLGADGSKIDSIEGKGTSVFREYNSGNNCRLPSEVYSGTFYVDGQFFGKLEFKVTDKKWEFVQK